MKRFVTESDRLEAFSDGVIAVIITIMVLELHPPQSTDFTALLSVAPTFAVYVLSYVFVGIYWNNHHHLIRASRGIDGLAMWANLHLLFWLSLVPFTTAWLGRNPTAVWPTALYALDMLLCAFAYAILVRALLRVNGADGRFAHAVKTDLKGRASVVASLLAVGLAFVSTIASDVILFIVAVLWLVPDRRFEPIITAANADSEPSDEAAPAARTATRLQKRR